MTVLLTHDALYVCKKTLKVCVVMYCNCYTRVIDDPLPTHLPFTLAELM